MKVRSPITLIFLPAGIGAVIALLISLLGLDSPVAIVLTIAIAVLGLCIGFMLISLQIEDTSAQLERIGRDVRAIEETLQQLTDETEGIKFQVGKSNALLESQNLNEQLHV